MLISSISMTDWQLPSIGLLTSSMSVAAQFMNYCAPVS